MRLYLNRGIKDGFPRFEDVTDKVGLKPLPMKAPHVEIQDFDNDGWPDVYVSIVKFAGGKPYPVILKNLGIKGGLPQFREDALAVNDFPTEEDRKSGDVVKFFERMEREQKIVYMAPGPSADFDRDGRLDLFLANWWVKSRSLLLRNETPSGNWLQVAVRGTKGVNRMGIGSVVRLYPAGKMGQKDALLGAREISVGYGYASGQEAIAHFGRLWGTRLTHLLGFRSGATPSKATYSRLFAALEVQLTGVLDLRRGPVRIALKVSADRLTAEEWWKLQKRGKEALTQAVVERHH